MSRRRPRNCEICGAEYRPTYGAQRTCGRSCGVTLRRAEHDGYGGPPRRIWPTSKINYRNCANCGKLFVARHANRKNCGDDCAYQSLKQSIINRYATSQSFRDRVLSAAHARRADSLGLSSNPMLLGYLIRRDHRRCGICRKQVKALRGPMRASIDHIIPLSRGGLHELTNVQLAHYRCNLAKNNRGSGEQLMLIG
jgi:ribosomal protein S27AE